RTARRAVFAAYFTILFFVIFLSPLLIISVFIGCPEYVSLFSFFQIIHITLLHGGKIKRKYLFPGASLLCHNVPAILRKSKAMAPSFAQETDFSAYFLYG